MAFIQTIETEVPQYEVSRQEAADVLGPYFAEAGESRELINQIFENVAIDRRCLARPPSFLIEHRSLTERNEVYAEVAKEIGIRVAEKAIANAGFKPQDIDAIIDTSCTGLLIPALDSYVVNALGMRKDVRRMPFNAIGCAGGAVALSRAQDYLRAYPDQKVLVLCVELPSLTLQLGDTSRANLISSAIFGDGAVATVITAERPERPSFEIVESKSIQFAKSTNVLGFNLKTEGLQIVLSPRIPLIVKRRLRAEVDDFLAPLGLSLDDIGFQVLHPGGTKVLDNLRDTLGLVEEQIEPSRRILRQYGNMSSAAVLFVAKDFLDRGTFQDGEHGFLASMGPGFAVEMVLLKGSR